MSLGEPRKANQLSQIVEVTSTFANREDAMKMASSLLEDKLVACSQISGPITSVYRWEGAVQISEEYSLRTKTSVELLADVCTFIQQHHPYQLPEVVWQVINASQEYASWVRSTCK